MLYLLATLTAAVGMVTASPEAPQWHDSYGKALKQTRVDQRPLLVVIDKPTEEEQSFEAKLLATDKQADVLKPYDLCHIDASTEYGQKVAKAFKTEKFPYLAIIDKSGSVILHTHTGSVTEQQWGKMLVEYKAGERPVRRSVAKPATSSYSYPATKPYCAKCQRGY